MTNEIKSEEDKGLKKGFRKLRIFEWWEKRKEKKKEKKKDDQKNELRNIAQSYKNTVEEAYDHAKFAYRGDPPNPIKDYKEIIDKEFEELKKSIDKLETQEDFDYIDEHALELLNDRAFIYPENELEAEATAKREEVLSWKVTGEQVAPIERSLNVIKNEKTPESEKRAHLLKIYEDYDELDDYVDWINAKSLNAGILLVSVTIIGLGLSFLFLTLFHQMLLGILAAGVSGATLSILMKLPARPTQYGKIKMFVMKALARFATGVLATVVGYGFLAANVLTFNFNLANNTRSVSDLLKDWDWNKATISDVLLLVSIGVILGFTERFFTRIAGSFLPEKEPSAKKSEG